jgi:hypothetical protein
MKITPRPTAKKIKRNVTANGNGKEKSGTENGISKEKTVMPKESGNGMSGIESEKSTGGTESIRIFMSTPTGIPGITAPGRKRATANSGVSTMWI